MSKVSVQEVADAVRQGNEPLVQAVERLTESLTPIGTTAVIVTRATIESATRTKLQQYAKALGVTILAKEKGIDFRSQTTDWMRRQCLKALETERKSENKV